MPSVKSTKKTPNSPMVVICTSDWPVGIDPKRGAKSTFRRATNAVSEGVSEGVKE